MTVSEKKALKIRLQLSAGGVTGRDNFILGTRVQDAPGSLASVILPSCANLPLQQTAYLSCQTACLPTSPPSPRSCQGRRWDMVSAFKNSVPWTLVTEYTQYLSDVTAGWTFNWL